MSALTTSAVAYPSQHPTDAALGLAHAKQRLYELGKQEELLAFQKAAYKAIVREFTSRVCGRCEGRGRESIPRSDGDGTTSQVCSRCNGSGKP